MADHQVNPPSGEEVRDPSSSADKAVVQMRTQTSTASDLVQSEMRNSPTEDQSCGFGDRQMQQALQASEESVDSTPGSMKDPITMSDHTLKEVGQNPAPQISVKPAPLQTGRKKGLKAGLKLDLGSSSRFNRKNNDTLVTDTEPLKITFNADDSLSLAQQIDTMYSYVESEYWEDAHGFFERDINVFSRSLKDRSQLGAGGISGTSNGNIFAREEIGKEDVGATGGVNSAMLGGTDFSPERIGNEDAVGIAWRELAVETKKAYIQSLLDRLCDGNRKVCTDALGALQYLCQGNYGNRCEAVRKDVGPDGVVEARKRNEQAVLAELKANAKLLFSLDTISHVMWCLCQQLKDRLQSQTSHNPGSPPHSRKQSHTQSQETHGPKATKESRRSIGSKAGVRKGLGGLGMRRGLNVVCTIVLVHTYECDTDTRRRFRAYLESPMSFSRDCLLMSVYSLVLQFGQPAVTHLPINKLLLLLKTVLDALVDGRGVEGQETQYNAHARELAHEDVCTCTPHESVQEENSESGAVHTKPPTETHASATTNSYGYNDAERRVEVNTRRQLQALATEKPIGPVTRHEGSQAELKNKAQTELKPQPQAERKNQPQSLASTDTKLGKDEVSNLNTGSAECSPPSLTQTSAQTRTNTSTHGPEHPHSHSHSAIREATKESTPGSDNGTAMHKPTTTTKPVHAPPPKPPAYKRRPKASSESKTGTGEVPKIVPDSVLPAEARVDAEDRLKGLQRSVTQPNMRTGMGWADGGGRLDRPAEREGGRDTGSTGIGHGEKLMENRGELMSRNDIDSVRGSSGHLAPIGTGEWVQGSSGKLTDTARAVKEGVSISTELTGEKCETDRNRLTGRKSAAELDRDGEPAGEEGSNGLATDDAPNAGNGNSTQVVADKIVEDKSSPGDSRVSDRSPGDSRVSDRSPYVSRKRGRAHMHTQPSVAPPSFPIRPTETDCGSDTCVAAAESETSEETGTDTDIQTETEGEYGLLSEGSEFEWDGDIDDSESSAKPKYLIKDRGLLMPKPQKLSQEAKFRGRRRKTKVSTTQLDEFLSDAEAKKYDYYHQQSNDLSTALYNAPPPVREGLHVLQSRLYMSRAQRQMHDELGSPHQAREQSTRSAYAHTHAHTQGMGVGTSTEPSTHKAAQSRGTHRRAHAQIHIQPPNANMRQEPVEHSANVDRNIQTIIDRTAADGGAMTKNCGCACERSEGQSRVNGTGHGRMEDGVSLETDNGDRGPEVRRRLLSGRTYTDVIYEQIHTSMQPFTILLLKVVLAATASYSKLPGSIKILNEFLEHRKLGFGHNLPAEALDALHQSEEVVQFKEDVLFSATSVLFLLSRWLKASHIMQFEHFSAIAVKANALLLCVKILQQDMDKFLMRTTSDVAPVSKVTPSPQISGGAYGIPPHALRAQLAAREKQREEAIERAASAGAVQSSLPAGERIYGPECRFFRFVSEIKRDTHYLHHKFKPTHTRPLPSLAGTEIRSESDLFDAAIRELSGHVDRHASPSEDITHLEVGTSLRELATSTADQSTKDEDTDEAVADKDSHKMPLRRQQFTQSPAQLRQTELARRGLSPDTVVAESTPSPPPSTASIRLPVVAQKAASSSKGTDTTQSLRNYITVLNILRVIQKLTKNKADRVRLLVQFKAHSVFRTLIRIDNEAINIYALKVLKSMLTYLPRKWRNSNMLVVTGIYLRLGSTLKDHWTITDPDLQPPPHTLQQAALLAEQIATFNRYHYEEEDTYSEATGSLWATIETDGYVDRIESRLCSSLQASGDDTIWNNPTGVVHEWEFELWMRREGVFLLFGS